MCNCIECQGERPEPSAEEWIGSLEKRIADLEKKLVAETERASYAWTNTNTIEKSRQRLQTQRDELLAALQEVVRVFEEGSPAIVDTVWVAGGSPETLYDHCQTAIAKVKT